MKSSRTEIKRLVKSFRNLVGWKITYDVKSDYKGQCAVNEKKKRATIYVWGNSYQSSDYILYKVLRIAYRTSRLLGCKGEEIFV